MAGTTFSQFTSVNIFPPSGSGAGGSVDTTNKVLMSTGGSTVWTTVPIAAGGTGGTTPQTALDAIASPAGTNLNLGGNINLSSGAKISGDFSNSNVGSRTVFQTNVTNGSTYLTAIPKGSVAAGGNASVIELHDSTSAAGNGSILRIANIQDSEMRYSSVAVGVGTVRPVTFYVGNARVMTLSSPGTNTTTTLTGTGLVDFVLQTQTANTYTVLSMVDNTGNPYTHFRTNNAAGVIYQDFSTHHFRNTTGSNLLVLGTNGQIGVGSSANYGTAGQFLQSNGGSSAPSWTSSMPSNTTGTTQPAGTNNTTFATTAFVTTAVSNMQSTIVSGTVNNANTATTATTASSANALQGYVPSVSAAANTIALRSGDGSVYGTYFYGRATSANYADLAEIYTTDEEYAVGTVVTIGENVDSECTQSTRSGQYVLGTISDNPAYLMNAGSSGQAVALVGRVPVRVIGAVYKGQRIMSSDIPGVGVAGTYQPFAVALETNLDESEKLVECVVK